MVIQIHHKKMISLQWAYKLGFRENIDPQTSEENNFSRVCVCMWAFKEDLYENAAPYTLQKMMSLLCVSTCGFSKWIFLKMLFTTLH